jgi:hypothetical protein
LYYGVFLEIRRWLRERGIRAATVASVATATGQVPGLEAVGNDLIRLHAFRNRCDYDDGNEFTPEDVRRAVRLSAGIRTALETFK